VGNELSSKKIDVIYELRESVEAKVRLEQAAQESPSPGARAALLDAQLAVEEKTQEAIELCHQCGHEHGPSEACEGEARAPKGNVLEIDFPSAKPAEDG
jgi:hypothetical protein